MPMGGGAGDGGASAARRAEDQRQINVRNGTAAINDTFDKQFTPDFYKGRSKAYLDFATPQLNDQYADARKQLTYSLDRNGTLDSVARTNKDAELQKQFDINKRGINDAGLDYENKARTGVEAARGNLINTLSATGDAQGATQGAINQASTLTAPDPYQPLGQLFSNFTGALGTQAGLEKMDAVAGSGIGRPQIGTFNTGLFKNRDSVKLY